MNTCKVECEDLEKVSAKASESRFSAPVVLKGENHDWDSHWSFHMPHLMFLTTLFPGFRLCEICEMQKKNQAQDHFNREKEGEGERERGPWSISES